MDEYEREERVAAAEAALESMTATAVNWALLGEARLAKQATNVAQEIAQEFRGLQDGAG
jgi:hypothetical protein